jgi:hypothetical protein
MRMPPADRPASRDIVERGPSACGCRQLTIDSSRPWPLPSVLTHGCPRARDARLRLRYQQQVWRLRCFVPARCALQCVRGATVGEEEAVEASSGQILRLSIHGARRAEDGLACGKHGAPHLNAELGCRPRSRLLAPRRVEEHATAKRARALARCGPYDPSRSRVQTSPRLGEAWDIIQAQQRLMTRWQYEVLRRITPHLPAGGASVSKSGALAAKGVGLVTAPHPPQSPRLRHRLHPAPLAAPPGMPSPAAAAACQPRAAAPGRTGGALGGRRLLRALDCPPHRSHSRKPWSKGGQALSQLFPYCLRCEAPVLYALRQLRAQLLLTQQQPQDADEPRVAAARQGRVPAARSCRGRGRRGSETGQGESQLQLLLPRGLALWHAATMEHPPVPRETAPAPRSMLSRWSTLPVE